MIIKGRDGEYLILQLLDSARDDIPKGHTETCSLTWTIVSKKGAASGILNCSIRYESKEIRPNVFMLSQTGGSDSIKLGDFSLKWSYGSSEKIFLYPAPGTEYLITKVEQIADGKPPEASQPPH